MKKKRICPYCGKEIFDGYYEGKITQLDARVNARMKNYEWVEVFPHTCEITKEDIDGSPN